MIKTQVQIPGGLYLLLRNEAVVKKPLAAGEAVELISSYWRPPPHP